MELCESCESPLEQVLRVGCHRREPGCLYLAARTAPHFHVWIRSGRVYTMRPRIYRTRAAANKAAVKLRAQATNRMVLACEGCPETMRSKRAPVRWTKVAAAVGVKVEDLRAAIATEKNRPG